jgi:hypothetical protein
MRKYINLDKITGLCICNPSTLKISTWRFFQRLRKLANRGMN